jgi:hypothetical protein
MSLGITLSSKKEIYISADTRESIFIDNKLTKLHDNAEKIFVIHNKVIFCSGFSKVLDDTIEEFKKCKEGTIQELFNCSRKALKENPQYNDEELCLCMVIAEYSKQYRECMLHSIVNYENKVLTRKFKDNITTVDTFGFATDRANELIDTYLNDVFTDKEDTNAIYQYVYDGVCSEGIGGDLLVYKVSSKGIELNYKNPIKDNVKDGLKGGVTYNKLKTHYIFSDKILFTRDNWASYSVAITSEGIKTSQKFTLYSENSFGGNNLISIDGNKISIYGDGTEGSGIEIYNLLNERTIYLDSNGNANFTGVVTGGVIQTAVTGNRIVLEDNSFKTYKNVMGVDKLNGICFGDGFGGYGDIYFHSQGNEVMRFYDTITDGIRIEPIGDFKLMLGANDKDTRVYGNIYLSDSQSVNGLDTDSAGSHSHTIEIDGVTYTTSSSGSHTHNVKKA